MYIKKIKLKNFRNYIQEEIELDKNINVFYGDNAQGKTNIIESIVLCAMGKSFRTKKDKELINFDSDICEIEVEYEKEDRAGKIKVIIGDSKEIFINGVKQTKFSNILGKINIVTFSPDDIEIIKGGPQKRRKFIDIMISTLKPNYVQLLNNYNRVLEERNNYLKQIVNENKKIDLLDVFDEQLAELSFKIYEYRNEFLEKFSKIIQENHNIITKKNNQEEIIKIKYISNANSRDSFLDLLKKSRNADLKKGFTSIGIHRDDFIIYINKKIVSIFGSQGQQRTATLTLKLCELKIVSEEIGEKPILLLDDFMSELDEKRRKGFIENLDNNQVVITCTDNIEIENKNLKQFYVENGKIK